MRRSASVHLVLLPMLATAAVASAQPGPQDPDPGPPPQPQQPQPGDPPMEPPGMTDPGISPPGMTAPSDPSAAQPMEDGVVCDAPETWPIENQQLGVPPYECSAVIARCDDPATWDPASRELGVPPEGCERAYGVYILHGGYRGGGVIRGGFGHYFGTGGG